MSKTDEPKADEKSDDKADDAKADKKGKKVDDGLLHLRHPDGATSVSWGGHTYEADEKGVFRVPHAAAADLIAHGFKV